MSNFKADEKGPWGKETPEIKRGKSLIEEIKNWDLGSESSPSQERQKTYQATPSAQCGRAT